MDNRQLQMIEVFLFFSLVSNLAVYGQTPKDRLLSAAGQGWKHTVKNQSDESIVLIEKERGAQGKIDRCLRIESDGQNWLVMELERPDQTEDDSLEVWGRNNRYAFRVERSNAAEPWQLEYIGSLDDRIGSEGQPPSLLKAAW